MIINITYVHCEYCISQMNMKLLSLNEESELLSIQFGDIICFEVPKRGSVTIRGNTVFITYPLNVKGRVDNTVKPVFYDPRVLQPLPYITTFLGTDSYNYMFNLRFKTTL